MEAICRHAAAGKEMFSGNAILFREDWVKSSG